MSKLETGPGRQLHYRVDDFTDPWQPRREAVLLLHGLAESGAAWFAWVPGLARRFAVIRPDLPGFGESTPVADGGRWSVDEVADDLARLVAHLGYARVHVIGQRAGGAIALNLALRHPQLLHTMTLISAPLALPQSRGTAGALSWREQLARDGVEGLNRKTMAGRLGNAPQGQQDWWLALMNRTPLASMMAAAAAMETLDLASRLPEIATPTLLISSDTSTLVPLADVVAARSAMQRARLLVLPRDSYHLAATHPDECLGAALRFIEAASR